MKVPCRWLADYVEIEVNEASVSHLAERLTLAGLEVEEIVRTDSIRGAFVGRVESVRPHPDSDHLSLCVVNVGHETLDIVCGASNVVADALVPVVTVGGELPGGFKITKRKLRGETSHGMICSKAELGLEESSSGIWILDPALGLEIGTDLNDLLEYDDFILDFKVASNRPDCASVYGVAREAAAVLDLPLLPLDLSLETSLPRTEEQVKIEIENAEDTPRYAARLMDGLVVGPSPLKIQHRLAKAGMRPLSNLVDATNYVMLELGHPLHPFDADLLTGAISIRRAAAGETFRTLDAVDRELTEDVLMIADADGGIALAGVMGGERSEIRENTTRMLLEIATFSGTTVRRSSRAAGVRSEASQRFERNLDPESVTLAADRAAHLIQKLTGCRVYEGMADAYPTPSTRRTLTLRPTRAREVLGIELPSAELLDIFRRLQIPARADSDAVTVEVPTWRPDLEREIDLVEDAGRIHGYDRFPSIPPKATVRIGRKDRIERGKDRLREILVGLGLTEAISDGFDERTWREAMELPEDDLIAVRNPMSAAQAALRSSLLPGILSIVDTNLSRGVDGGMLFEIGRIFSRTAGERDSLAGAMFGRTGLPLKGKERITVTEGKGILDRMLSELRHDGTQTLVEDLPGYLHPSRSAVLALDGKPLGRFGELSPSLIDRLPIPTPVLLFEFDVEALIEGIEEKILYTPLPRFPASKRDLSLSAPVSLPEAEVRNAIATEPEVESVLLYDIYQGEQVAEGRKSLTYELSLRIDRTLTDEETAEIIGRIEARLADLDVHLRS